jgi:hypothetical protein
MYTRDDAPEGPGWYIHAFSDSNVIISPKRIATPTAETLGATFEDALKGQLEANAVSPNQLVNSGSNLVRAAIQQKLEYAEEQARQIAGLRRLLQNETPDEPAMVGEPD